MRETSAIEARLRAAATLTDTLAAGFDAFEIIRLLARDCEDRVPGCSPRSCLWPTPRSTAGKP